MSKHVLQEDFEDLGAFMQGAPDWSDPYMALMEIVARHTQATSKRCPSRLQKSPAMKFHRLCGVDVDLEPMFDDILEYAAAHKATP